MLLLYFYFENKIVEMKKTQSDLSEYTAKVQSKEEFYGLNFELNNKMTGIIAPNEAYIEEKEIKYLSELVNKRPRLIFRFTHKNCNTCYEDEIAVIQEEFKDCQEIVTILCSYFSQDVFYTFKRQNRIKTNIYHISFEAFDWDVEKYNVPYYFILHPDMKISHIHVPESDYPELNRQYLEGVKRFLSEHETEK